MIWAALGKGLLKGAPLIAIAGALIWVAHLAESRTTLRAENEALTVQNELLRENARVCQECEAKAAECLKRLDLARVWQERYESRPVRRVVVKVPVDVVPEGSTCDEAVMAAAQWLGDNPPPWESGP